MNLSWGKSRRSIARSLVAVFVITILQVISGPQIFLSTSNAAQVSVGTACESTVTDNSAAAVESVALADYCVLRFKSGTNSWTPPVGVTRAYVLVVGGGGGGGNNAGAGGGGGALIYGHFATAAAASFSISVGSGGAAGIYVDGTTQMDGQNGGASTFVSNNSAVSLNAGGGTGGGTHWANNYCGGSPAITGGTSGGSVSSTTGLTVISSLSGALGGGVNVSGGQAGSGNAGNSNSITGTNYSYGAGGGGGAWGSLWGSGGTTGGGNGGTSGAVGSDGAANSGSGGGGGGDGCKNGGVGGSGVVIIKWIPVPTLSSATSSTTYFNRAGAFSSSVTSSTTLTRSYQWMVSTNSGTSYVNVSDGSGATSTSYSSATINSTSSSYLYRMAATVSDSNISTTGYSAGVAASTQPLPGGETDTALSMSQTGETATQFARVNHTSDLVLTNNLTLQAWVRPTSFNSGHWSMVINKELSYELGITSSSGSGIGYWNYALKGSSWSGINTGVKVALNEWHHIAITRASGIDEVKFYLDGFLAFKGSADGASTGTISDSGLPLTIGARYNDGSSYQAQFKGQIDHVAIFSTVRTQTEIQSDMHSYNLSGLSGLLAYYDFNETSGSTVYNRKVGASSSSDLTLIGSDLFTDVKIVETSTIQNYTLVKFPRTYLNSLGGWKPPTGVTRISALIVAGGGGGGGGYQGGGGGAGGFIESTLSIDSSLNYPVIVGEGGQGALNPTFPSNGKDSSAFSLTAIGGGAGMAEFTISGSNQQRDAQSGGSGGAASHGTNRTGGSGTAGQGNAGANGLDIYPTCSEFAGGGGGGAGSAGFIAVCSDPQVGNLNHGGYGGSPKLSYVTNKYYAGGGGGSLRGANGSALKRGIGGNGDTSTAGDGAYTADVALDATGSATNAPANSGGGGGAGASSDGTKGYGGNGGSGFVAVRWITASVPSYTKPTNAYLNVGMTETFTTNVALDSATVNLTRTFRWESTTGGSGGTYSLIKQGTGAANASFSWVPTDTSTSGSNYLYRVIVTDSDTAGLFIVDTSTAVYAVINRALSVSGTLGIAKTINVAKSETFTITLGTSSYRTTLTSNNPGITLDTSIATSPVVRISDTMTVGTYYETLTVTDSVSASIVTPLTIIVAAPPNLLNTGEIVSDGLLFNMDVGNSSSVFGESGTAISVPAKDISGGQTNPLTSGTYEGQSCAAPTYSSDFGGNLIFDGTSQCLYIPYLGTNLNKNFSVETWVMFPSTGFQQGSAVITQNNNSTVTYSDMSFTLGALAGPNVNMRFGYRKGAATDTWAFSGTITTTPANVWKHLLGTYDGGSLKLYIDGQLQDSITTTSGLTGGSTFGNTSGYFIGVGFTNNKWFKGSIASARIYKVALSDTQVEQNYNATKDRFQAANSAMVNPAQKYGTTSSESFTATSGYGARTITYATGNRPGLSFTTSGDVTTLRMGESLTATTYAETITVTDSLGASTYLPIKLTVSKADTLTIAMDTATTVVYNASPITVYPKIYFKGLAGVDTLTASTRFTSATYTDSATVPTEVDTYTVIAANPVFSVGALSNYIAVVYETSTAKVTQANQNKLSINLYGAIAGTPFLIQTSGGSGDGLVTESVTAGSSATGCSVSNHVLSNTSPSTQQLTCNILVTKAASKNYKVETLTATVYFMLYVNNMPTNQVGSGSTIALNGVNQIWVDPGVAPTITSFPSSSARNVEITVNGSGFTAPGLVVEFNFYQVAPSNTVTIVSDSQIRVIVPNGATTGPLVISNNYGTAFSTSDITVG